MYFVLTLLLLGFGVSLAVKCISMNNQSCLVRPTHIDLTPDEHCYYLFVTSLDKFDGNYNTVESPFNTIYAPTEK